MNMDEFKSRKGLNFFWRYFHYCLNSVHYCEDRFQIHTIYLRRRGRYFSPLFLQRVCWGSFILWMLIGTSKVSILFSLFFCLHLFRVFFRQDACLNVFCCISIQNQVFLLHKLGVVVECFCYSCAYTLYNVYLFIIKKQCWLPDAHLLFSMKMVLCFVVVLL